MLDALRAACASSRALASERARTSWSAARSTLLHHRKTAPHGLLAYSTASAVSSGDGSTAKAAATLANRSLSDGFRPEGRRAAAGAAEGAAAGAPSPSKGF